jgi:hypothetical protein
MHILLVTISDPLEIDGTPEATGKTIGERR